MSDIQLPEDVAAVLGIRHEPGWSGGFTRHEAPGMFPNGTRVMKTAEDPTGDVTPLGKTGKVLGSIRLPGNGLGGYFVEWDDKPKCATLMVETKVTRVRERN